MAAPGTLFSALTAAMGEAIGGLSGLRLTRLTQAASLGDTVLQLERTDGLPTPGSLAIDSVAYSYTSITRNTVTGLTYKRGGLPVFGAAANHAIGAQVTDISGTYTSIDQAKRALFVDTAEGDDLSALGRNLGVLRLPSLEDDEQFRELIKVLAYNPRGTCLGLRLVLEALAGAGNYSVSEDLQNYPCEVFITVPGALFLNTVSSGKAYLGGTVNQVLNGPTFNTDTPAFAVESVRLPAFSLYLNCRNQTPDANVNCAWRAAAGSSTATAEASVQSTPQNGGGTATTFNANAGYYSFTPGPAPGVYAAFECRVCFSPNGNFSNDNKSFGVRLQNGQNVIAWGCVPQSESNMLNIGLINATTGAFLSGGPTLISYNVFHTVRLSGSRGVQALSIDGTYVQQSIATQASTTAFSADIGALGTASTPIVQMTDVGLDFTAGLELLNLVSTTTLTASIDTANNLTASSAVFLPTDTGKTLRIANSKATNSSGGNNNGTYTATYKSNSVLSLTRAGGLCDVNAAYPSRISLENAALTYPDDLGKSLTLGPSKNGNAGTYVIARILDPDRLTDFSSVPSTQPRVSHVCELTAANLVTESALPYAFLAASVSTSRVDFTLVDAAIHSQTSSNQASVTLRQALPVQGANYALNTTVVRSAQVYDTDAPLVSELSDGSFSAAPFYVSDPSNFIRQYLEGVVAAGVQLNFNFS